MSRRWLDDVLHKLNRAANDDHRDQAKLFSFLLGLKWSNIEKANSIQKIYGCLSTSENTSLSSRSVAVLQSMLTVIGVDSDTVAELGCKKQLDECKRQLPRFDFAEMIIKVIKDLGKEKFEDLKYLVLEDLGKTHPENIKKPEDLFRELYTGSKISPGDVGLLVEALERINLCDTAKIVKEYQQKHCHRSMLHSISIGNIIELI